VQLSPPLGEGLAGCNGYFTLMIKPSFDCRKIGKRLTDLEKLVS